MMIDAVRTLMKLRNIIAASSMLRIDRLGRNQNREGYSVIDAIEPG
jgi:hypothetical protein